MKIEHLHSVRIVSLTFLLVLAWSMSGSIDTTNAYSVTSTSEPTGASFPALQTGPESMTAEEIFAQVSPSIAFVETPRGQGGGVLIEEGYVVTNAHVVWPYAQVRVVFPDGSEFPNAPVHNWDLLGDLAVIGPLETAIEPAVLGDGEKLGIGSDVYLIGYPGEVDEFPEPTLTRGLISRLREWAAIDMTFFQTDAVIAGGQSGGVLVSPEGEVIGISGLRFSESRFGLVASVADVLPRLKGLMAGEDVAGLGDRRLPLHAELLRHDFRLENDWHCRMYVLHPPRGTTVELAVEGKQNAALALIDAAGNTVFHEDSGGRGSTETGSATTTLETPYFVVIWQNEEDPGDFRISSSYSLVPYQDYDDGIRLTIDQPQSGNIDYPFDFDVFELDLAAGETIDVSVESILIDPMLTVDFKGATEAEMREDDDGGAGVLGLNAALTYRAPHTGRYLIVVRSAVRGDIGGYVLTVTEASPDAVVAAPQPAGAPIASRHGPMSRYESAQYPFSIQHPAGWIEQPVEEGVTASFVSGQGGGLAIAEEDFVKQGFGETTLADYVDLILFLVESENPSLQLVSREETVTLQGLPVAVLEFTLGGGLFSFNRFIYVHENRVAFNATYHAPRARQADLERVIDYSFDSFRVWLPGQEDQDPVFFFDQGVERLAEDEMEMAIEAFSQAIELDPTLTEAFSKRASAYRRTGRYSDALADANKAIELNPEDTDRYHSRAFYHWLLADHPAALADMDHVLELDSQDDEAFNLRALFHTSQGDYEAALADINKALELRPTNNAHLLDTRGFVYLKSGQYEAARSDFEEIFSRDLEFSYALLGGGLAYAGLGESDEALALLEQGLAEAGEFEFPDPQLVDLIEMTEQTLSNIRISTLAQSRACPPACSQVDLSNADLSRTSLASVDLSRANLSRTNLARADLSGADLAFANLSEANLIGANLVEADLSQTTLQEAIYDDTTTWPTDLDPVQAGLLTRDEALEKHLVRGQANYDAGQFEDAIRDFSRVLELDPDDAEFYNLRGVAYRRQEAYDQAIADFAKAIDLIPDFSAAYFQRAEVHDSLADYWQAIANYSSAIRFDYDPLSFAYNNRGNAYTNIGDWERAYQDYSQAIELNPDDPDFTDPYLSRAWIYLEQGDFEQAIADYGQAIALVPALVDAYHNRGWAYYKLGDYEQAIADYDTVTTLVPDDGRAYNNRGMVFRKLGNNQQALDNFTAAIELNHEPLSYPYLNRGWLYYTEGNLQQASADLGKVIELVPDPDAGIRTNPDLAYFDPADLEQALAALKLYLELEPDTEYRDTVVNLTAALETLELPQTKTSSIGN